MQHFCCDIDKLVLAYYTLCRGYTYIEQKFASKHLPAH